MTTKLTVNNLTPETLAAISGPRISNVQIVDSQYNTLDDTAANVGGGYIIINGQSFNSAAQVLIDQTPATTITWVSNTQIRAEIPASTEGASKSVYVINPDGSLALLVNGLTYSAFPAWSTGSTLTSSEALVPISIQLSAPSATVYTLAAANTLPSSLSLYANGLIAGTVAANTTTNYNFTVNAKDAENQDTSRNFTLPITQNVEPAWVTSVNLGSAFVNENYSNTLVATDLSSITYSVAVGSSLPANLTLAANGLLSGSVSSANTYSFAIVATDTANLSNTRTFSISIITPDPYSPYNTLLLNGEGTASTNGANNNVFIDSSTNNFNIQRNGNASQGTFSPYGYNWSNYFDGTGDYLTLSNNTLLGMGSGNFTVEFWLYQTAFSNYRQILDVVDGNSAGRLILWVGSDGTLSNLGSNGTTRHTTSSGAIVINTWTHVALVRSSGTTKFYINGTQSGSNYTDSTNYTCTTGTVYIGINSDGSTYPYLGYISNFRMVKGTAVYTSAFTPPTSPLTAIANTSLLTCQSNRFIDNSTNSFTLTRNGDVSVQAFHPFLQTATNYTPSLYGGSAYFDGTGDYLSASGNTAFAMSTGNFTYEAWINPSSISTYFPIISQWPALTTSLGYFLFSINSSRQIELYYDGQNYLTFSSTTVTLNTWNHVAIIRSGSTITGYINGVVAGTVTWSGIFGASGTNLEIGGTTRSGGNLWANGYISNLRIVKGTAVYTTAFTPPTSPLTAIANTSLLTNFTNAGIIDQTGKNNLETLGGAQLSTAVKKYNNASIYFDGTEDYLYSPPNINTNLSGVYTVECWFYSTSLSSDAVLWFNGTYGNDDNRIQLTVRTTGRIDVYSVNTGVQNYNFQSSTGVISANTWYHAAVVNNGTTITLYVNGTSVASSSITGTPPTVNILYIGYGRASAANVFYTGYIDDLRITKGYARYTANFTPPTAIT